MEHSFSKQNLETNHSQVNPVNFVLQDYLQLQPRGGFLSKVLSPKLDSRLAQIKPKDNLFKEQQLRRTTHRTKLNYDRVKYVDIKERINMRIRQANSLSHLNLAELLKSKQNMLIEFLGQYVSQLEKECHEKGQILRYIWNSMFTLLSHLIEMVGQGVLCDEKQALDKSISTHKGYQQIISAFQRKQVGLISQKDSDSKIIESLVYELRFKKKEIKKLYRNQRLLLNEINQYKKEHVELQSSYLDMLSSFSDTHVEDAPMLMKARLELNKTRHLQIGVAVSKKKAKKIISEELEKETDPKALTELCKDLQTISAESNGQASRHKLISSAIENFCLKSDTKFPELGLISISCKLTAVDACSQTEQYFHTFQKISVVSQTSIADKIISGLARDRSSQTTGLIKKCLMQCSTQVSAEMLRSSHLRLHICKNYEFNWFGQEAKEMKSSLKAKKNFLQKEFAFTMGRCNMSAILEARKHHEGLGLQGGILTNQHSSTIEDEEEDDASVYNSEVDKQGNRETEATGSVDQNIRKSELVNKQNVLAWELQRKRLRKSESSFKVRDSRSSSRFANQISSEGQRINKSKIFSSRGGFHALSGHMPKRGSAIESGVKRNKENEITNSDELLKFSQSIVEEVEEDFFIGQETRKERPETGMQHVRRRERKIKLQHSQKMIPYKASDDDNEALKPSRKFPCKKRETIFCEQTYKAKCLENYELLKNNLETIINDIREVKQQKEAFLKKAVFKNQTNTYKILMMTFAKTFDYLRKGTQFRCLALSLYQSFGLVYGAANSVDVYQKMVNFLAMLSFDTENTIFKFFLFLLGLYDGPSEKVSLLQISLSLNLLDKLAVDGKVTTNITAIYTESKLVQDNLAAVLAENSVPGPISEDICKRIESELRSSLTGKPTSIKINIYNMITLVLQCVIRAKTKLTASFANCKLLFQDLNRIPSAFYRLLTRCIPNRKTMQKDKLDAQELSLTKICSSLFQNGLVNFDQLHQHIPLDIAQISQAFFSSNKRELDYNPTPTESLWHYITKRLKQLLQAKENEHSPWINNMGKIILFSRFQQRVQDLQKDLLGELMIISSNE